MTTWKTRIFLAIVLVCLPAQLILAQEPTNAELKKDIEVLKEGMKSLQKDLQDIKALLQSRQQPSAPQNVVLDLSDKPFKGDKTAKLALVEFTDFQCPFCARHVRDTHGQIEKEYIETGKLKYVHMDMPLEAIHKQAFKAAEAAHCANDQGKFWEMKSQLFGNQKTLDTWTTHAEAVGLDTAQFETCLSSSKYAAEVRKDIAQAQKAGITGTPAFLLATTDPASSKVRSVRFLSGAQPFAAFKAQIDAVLADQEKRVAAQPGQK